MFTNRKQLIISYFCYGVTNKDHNSDLVFSETKLLFFKKFYCKIALKQGKRINLYEKMLKKMQVHVLIKIIFPFWDFSMVA